MCGIVGQISFHGRNREAALGDVTAMATALVHRGPDDSGVWSDPSGFVTLGFRRLSIQDLSPTGHQPMSSHSGRYEIVFNGEIYNCRLLRQELRARGHAFRGTSDTEVLLAMVEEYGFAATLPRIRGMFAIALWDASERVLYLARDRFGEKPLYYGWAGSQGIALFGSELKAFRAHREFRGRVDRGALMRYLRRGSVPQSLCIYEGVRKLLPGTYLRIATADDLDKDPEPYYSIERVAEAGVDHPLDVDDDEAAALLDTELRRAVDEQMISDVPFGAFLSGGVDSSVIVALMQAQSARPIKTFSIGFDDASYNEAPWAKAIAEHLGTDHQELYVTGREALDVIPLIPTVYDEPFADSSQIPTILVSRLARRNVTVALTGDGSDEIFAGYPRYDMMRKLSLPFSVPGRRIAAGALQKFVRRFSRRGEAATLDRRFFDWLHRRADVAGALDVDAAYDLYMSLWYHPEWLVPGVSEPPGARPLPRSVLARGTPIERAMLADARDNLPDDLLVKVDRASMSVSLETRMPFLDPEVVALAWRLPLVTKARGSETKRVLRSVLRKYVPAKLFERPKMGFMIPLRAWLRGPLREWGESLLDERRLRDEGYLEPEIIRRRWNAFQAGDQDWHAFLWTVLMWETWLDANQSR